MKKPVSKILSSILALTLALSLAACASNTPAPSSSTSPQASTPDSTPASDEKEQVSLVLWGAQDDQVMLKEMVDDFIAAHPDKEYTIDVRPMGEDESRQAIITDADAGADVFAVAHDNLGDLVQNGAIYRNTLHADEIRANSIEGAINAATYDGDMYAWPSSAETYFLFYNTSVYSEEDVKSLDTMLEIAQAQGKNVGFDFGSAYFGIAYFFTNGGLLFGESGSDASDVNFNDENGVAVARYIQTLKDRGMVNVNSSDVQSQLQSGGVTAMVTGPWDANAYKELLGDDYGVAKLPTINVGGADQQMRSFAGFKVYCVNATTDHPVEAMDLANWLTNKDNQLKRYNDRGFLPVDKTLASDPAITSDETVKATVEQLAFAVAMPSIPEMSNFWDPTGAVLGDLFNGVIADSDIQASLDRLVAQIKGQ